MRLNFRAQKFKAHQILIYKLNLKDFPMDQLLEEDFPVSYSFTSYKGKPVEIEVKHDLQFQLIGKSKKYPVQKLYELLYGIEVEATQEIAFRFESSLFGPIQVAPDLLSKQSTSLPPSFNLLIQPYTFHNVSVHWEEVGERLHVHCLSPSGYSVATKMYRIQGSYLQWDSEGVFRLDPKLFSSKLDYVLVTDTPLEADYLQSKGIPAFSIPSESELAHYPYATLLAKKKVFLCTQYYGANYSYSIYPLLTELLTHQIEVFQTPVKRIDFQSLAHLWTEQSDPNLFLSNLIETSKHLRPSGVPSRGDYNELIETDRKPSIHLAQDYHSKSLLYALDSGEVVLSPPIRVFSPSSLPAYEGLVPHAREGFPESGLTRLMLEKIKKDDFLTPLDTYETLRGFIKRFIYFKHEEYFDVLCTWIMATYVFRVFKAFPYIHLSGKRGTGKSTILELVAELGFNGFFQTKATTSTSVEQADLHSSTLCIDEFEDYSGRRNSHDELSKFLNSGYNYLGSFTKRVGKKSTTFFTYCPKIFGGTGDITIDTLKSRTIPIETTLKPENVHKEQFLEFDGQTRALINQLKTSMYGFGLNHAQKLSALSMNQSAEITLPNSSKNLNNRQLELARPLLTIASFLEDQTIQSSLLKGLDICWYPKIRYSKERDIELHEVLTAYFNSTEPLVSKDDYPNHVIYNAKNIGKDPTIKAYWEKTDSGKKKFNKLIEETFDIVRTSEIRIPRVKNPSCYKVPRSFFEN